MPKRTFTRLITLTFGLLLLVSALAYGQPGASQGKFRRVEKAIPDSYIVVFKDSVPGSQVAAVAEDLLRPHGGQPTFIYEHALKGFAVHLPEAAAVALSKNPQVAYVEEETMNKLAQFGPTQQQLNPGPGVFFGLDRIDQRTLPLNNIYSYFNEGRGVVAYILDSGLGFPSAEFNDPFVVNGYRAFVAYDTFGGQGFDNVGHGTSVAGIIGGRTYGVAKGVALRAVKVCSTLDNCPTSNVIAGLNWVVANGARPAVVNMSLGGGPGSDALDTAVRNTMAAGVLTVMAAGNQSSDAALFSPSRVAEALTVGATLNDDTRANYSNYGGVVDVYAPGGDRDLGQAIPTIGADASVVGFDGTSAAAPHVTGVAALYLNANPNMSAYVLGGEIKKAATFNQVTNLPYPMPDNLLYCLLTQPVGHGDGTIPAYRYYNGQIGDHFYTTNFNELGPRKNGWEFEWIGFYIYATQQPGTVPLYQYYSGQITDHFYTTTPGSYYTYTFEKIAGYVFPDNGFGRVPLYRYYNSQVGDHFYTTNFDELGNGREGWVLENIECYVYQ